MSRPTLFWFAALTVLGVWFFLQNFRIDGIDSLKVAPRNSNGTRFAGWPNTSSTQVNKRTSDTIRIASFNIRAFGESKLQKPHVMDILARIVRQFDVVAIQEVRAKTQDVIPEFLQLINSNGSQYDYAIGPRLGRTSSKEQYVFIFDRTSLEIDRNELYTVEDPEDWLHREPLVGWFRVRGPNSNEAFTFSLVTIHVDPDEVPREMRVMPGVFSSVRSDARGEDDVILLGDFNANDQNFGPIASAPNISWVISRSATNTHGNAQLDNIFFDQIATREFTGRGGVFDFMREFNLSLDEALEVSDHLPVWAEFSIYEGGVPGRLAEQTSDRPR